MPGLRFGWWLALGLLALAGCSDPRRDAAMRAAAVGQWTYLDGDRPGQRTELDLAADGSCEQRLFVPGLSAPAIARGRWSVRGGDLIRNGCSETAGEVRSRLRVGGDTLELIGNEGSFPYHRRR